MLPHLWTKLSSMRFLLCQATVQDGTAGIVRRLGHASHCRAHADRDEAHPDRALQDLYSRHAIRHGRNRLLPTAVLPHARKSRSH
jgi:hypothetical protein